tara:strand:+ start:75 stop:338 length:264 start_codon:yes stop_codon:yes gene_type:complete
MLKTILKLFILIFIFVLMYLLITNYLSEKNMSKIYKNRKNVDQQINEQITNLPILKNDTDNIIEYNYGFNSNNKKIKRNFWNLLKND